jgi:hypothetical protein
MTGAKYVLVDFENIQPANLDKLRDRGFTLRIFVGSAQERVPLKIVNSLQVFGTSLEYIQTCGIGPNALDFYIAYFLGRQSTETPDARFFVVSRDTGFDPLLQHLRSQGVTCRRVTSTDDILHDQVMTEAVHLLSTRELTNKVVDDLEKRPKTRPRTVTTLRRAVNALFQKKLLTKQIDDVLLELQLRGVAIEVDGKLQYQFSKETKKASLTRSAPDGTSNERGPDATH